MITAWGTNDWGQCGKGIDGKGYIDIYNAKKMLNAAKNIV